MPFRRSWRILERVGRVREVPRRPQRHPRSRPKASKHRPRSAPGRPRDPKGRGRRAPDSLALALLGRRRATGLVSGAFAEIDVFLSKFIGFGGFGPPRIVAGGTGQCRRRQFQGLASSVWGLWIQIRLFAVGCGPTGARPGAGTSAQGRYRARFHSPPQASYENFV